MSNKLFTSVSGKSPKKNVFNLSHEKKLSLNMGELVPIFCEEIVPSDRFKVTSEVLLRVAPLVSPIMHRVDVKLEFFFVPSRTIWDNWEKFITGGVDGKAANEFPYLHLTQSRKGNFQKGTLGDYFGIPIPNQTETVISEQKINALPFRAYQKIYNEYYRDQTLTPEIVFPLTDGYQLAADQNILTSLRKRSWAKDYFTSALPTAQRGGDVLLPLESDITYKNPALVKQSVNDNPSIGNLQGSSGTGELITTSGPSYIDQIESIENQTTITDFRRASRLQEWLEAMSRGGARYIEQMASMFGVRSSDARLQRAEFLGSASMPIQISEVLSTFDNTETAGATMYGHGITAGSSFIFNKFFEEHGYVIGLLSVLPKISYASQGIPKMFQKFDKFEYYWPHFAHIGEQPIANKELWYDGTQSPENEETTFGYTPRYAEYKFGRNSVHGDFRDQLDYWHMARIFDSPPALNANFIEADPTQRIFAVTDEIIDKLYVQVYHNVMAVRPMPVFGTPHL